MYSRAFNLNYMHIYLNRKACSLFMISTYGITKYYTPINYVI